MQSMLMGFNVTAYCLYSFNVTTYCLYSFNVTAYCLYSFNDTTYCLYSFNVTAYCLYSFNVKTYCLYSFHCIKPTMCFFYRCPEQGSCHGMFWRKQPFHAIKLSCAVLQQKKHPIRSCNWRLVQWISTLFSTETPVLHFRTAGISSSTRECHVFRHSFKMILSYTANK